MPSEAVSILILILAVGAVVGQILVLRIHPFIALVAAATVVGILSPAIPFAEVMPKVAELFGSACASIAIVIALAALIGQCMMESGAADKIVRVFVRLFGEKRISISLISASSVLAIPVFFDTVFYLMVPLARAMRIRTGKNYVLYVMAVAGGGVLTHSLVPPTPGPLAMAANLNVDLGVMILAGCIASIPVAIVTWAYCVWVDRRLEIPFRETTGMSLADLEELANTEDKNLPGFLHSLMPILLPVILITSHTVARAIDETSRFAEITAFLGNPNFALLVSAALSLHLVAKYRGEGLKGLAKTAEIAFSSGGLIILITAGGGAFGGMLRVAGIGDALGSLAQQFNVPLLLLGFLLGSMFKLAQGSGTVSMITVSAIMAGIIGGTTLPYHIVYMALAIGSGSLVVSWMNDSGFWVVAKMAGFTEGETLKTWTLLLGVVGVTGFLVSVAGAMLFPLV